MMNLNWSNSTLPHLLRQQQQRQHSQQHSRRNKTIRESRSSIQKSLPHRHKQPESATQSGVTTADSAFDERQKLDRPVRRNLARGTREQNATQRSHSDVVVVYFVF